MFFYLIAAIMYFKREMHLAATAINKVSFVNLYTQTVSLCISTSVNFILLILRKNMKDKKEMKGKYNILKRERRNKNLK